jgi:hypothetical protein
MARARLDADLLAAAYERDARRMLVFFTRRLYDAQLAVDVVARRTPGARARSASCLAPSAAPPRRSRIASWRPGLLLAVTMLVIVPTAVATRNTMPAPATLPDAARPPDAVAPLHAGEQVYVATGSLRGVAWQLSASTCDYGDARAVGVFLSVPGGGGGARCDLATRGTGAGVSPDVLARRLVQTYFDPVANRTWAFGALPADAREVDVSATTAAATVQSVPADPEAVAKGELPPGMRVFVAALDGSRDVPAIAARDRSGRVLLTCEQGPLHPNSGGVAVAPVATDPCAGPARDMLGESGIVPDGVAAVFLTAPDGTAVRADVQDKGSPSSYRHHAGRSHATSSGPEAMGRRTCNRCRLSNGARDCTALTLGRGGGGPTARTFLVPKAPRARVVPVPRKRGRRAPPVAMPVPSPVFVPEPCSLATALPLLVKPRVPPRALPAPARPAPPPATPRRRGP